VFAGFREVPDLIKRFLAHEGYDPVLVANGQNEILHFNRRAELLFRASDEESAGKGWDITPKELAERLAEGNHIRIIDVREPHEWEISHIEGAELIPLGDLASRMNELDTAEDIVLQCKTGARSGRALDLLRTAGFRKLKNLKGGINAWARTVDPKLPTY